MTTLKNTCIFCRLESNNNYLRDKESPNQIGQNVCTSSMCSQAEIQQCANFLKNVPNYAPVEFKLS